MEKIQQIEQDLASIRGIMERSVKFLSLSGLSGILAGIYALLGSAYAYYLVYYPHSPFGFRFHYVNESAIILQLVLTGLLVLLASVLTAFILSAKKARKKGMKLWDKTSRRLCWNMAIPLAAGGVLVLALLSRGYFGIVAPSCLLFYGLALVNGSHFTYNDIRYLGYAQIALGLLCAFLPGYGLLFWATGFGLLHIIYGSLLFYKYD